MPRDYSRYKVGSQRQVENIDTSVEDDLTVADDLDVNGDADIDGVLTYHDQLIHGAEATVTKTANYTVDAADCGKTILCATDAVVFTLPSTAVGLFYRFVNTAADGDALISISPAAADKIQGAGLTAADDKDLRNTKATAKHGDMVELLGDGVDGWFITKLIGTWARE